MKGFFRCCLFYDNVCSFGGNKNALDFRRTTSIWKFCGGLCVFLPSFCAEFSHFLGRHDEGMDAVCFCTFYSKNIL